MPLENGCYAKYMLDIFTKKLESRKGNYMEAVRSGGDLENIGGCDKYCKDMVCPDGCVM